MKFLAADTQAMQIHGKTHVEMGTVTLERGTVYELVVRYEENGKHYQRILVNGYLYDIEERAPVYDEPVNDKQ